MLIIFLDFVICLQALDEFGFGKPYGFRLNKLVLAKTHFLRACKSTFFASDNLIKQLIF
jgi:hypothetical protein